MTSKIVRPRLVATGFVLALLAAATAAPLAGAQSQASVKSVGEIFVDAAGRASGQNVQTSIVEATGVLEAFTALALDAEIFASVKIDGFAQAEKLQGVGSSTILLRGSNAVVSVYDNINSAFKVQATSPTTVQYDIADGMRAQARGQHALDVYDATGAYVGSLVVIGANGAAGQADAVTIKGGDASVRLNAGSQVVWHAKPVYAQSDAYTTALVGALESGRLASLVVTEFEGSGESRSSINYFGHVKSETRASAGEEVSSRVASRSEKAAVLAYDLAYETLPAKSASELSVFVNGKAAARAENPHAVRENADAGVASWYAITANGRTQILASTPDFKSQAEHTLTFIAASAAGAQSESQAKADARADSRSRATGEFLMHANGKLTGAFTSGILANGDAAVYEYTDLAKRVTLFDAVRLEGSGSAEARQVTAQSVRVDAPQASLTLVDDAYANMILEARESSQAAFDLGAGVHAVQESTDRVRLEGPNGYLGMIILASADAAAAVGGHGDAPEGEPITPPNADGGEYQCMSTECRAPGRLAVTDEGTVRAQMEKNARVVYRSGDAGRAFASEDVIAQAIAEGRVGAQVLAGHNLGALAANAVSYAHGVDARAFTESRSAFSVDYTTSASKATAFVFDSRGTALAAKHASDVEVLVNGKAAMAVSTPQAVFAAGNEARYFVESALDGSTRVLVNTAQAAYATATVDIQSKVRSEARANANKDAFGTFRLFEGGTAVGSFVTLTADQQAGVVNDFSIISTGEKVFSSIVAGGSAFASASGDGASELKLENRESALQFTDTTNAYMKLVAKQTTKADFTLAPQVRAEKQAAGVIELVNAQGAHVGSLIITNVEGSASASSSFQSNAQNQVTAFLDKGTQVIFRAHVGIEQELDAASRSMMNQAIANGRVAGHVVVQTSASLSAQAHQAAAAAQAARAGLEATSATAIDGGATAVSAIEASGKATTSVTASYYNDVQMLTAATQDRVDVTISSMTSVGKTVLISLDPATIPGLAAGNAEILVDGRAAAQADSYADILNPLDDDGAFEYFVLAGEAGSQVLVSLPHFSTHTVTLKAKETSGTPVFMLATLFLGAIVVAETVLLVRARRSY